MTTERNTTERSATTERTTSAARQASDGLGRRDLLRALGAGAAVAAAAGSLSGAAQADSETNDEKRRARYQPNAADVQAYYRVNRYPS